MSLPEFSTTTLSREDAINQIISSIAMEELGLSHIINAEGEKLQYVLGTIPGVSGPAATIEDVLKVNESVRMVLQNAAESQSHLRNKLQNVLSSAVLTGPTGATGATGTAALAAYGNFASNSAQTLTAAGTRVNMDINLSVAPVGMAHTAGSPDITIIVSGIYRIDYRIRPATADPGASMQLLQNIGSVPNSIVPGLAAGSESAGVVIISVAAGDTIAIGTIGAGVTLAADTNNAFLDILRIA